MNNHQPVLPPLIVVVGRTAVGKTATAICLCQDFSGEIVSAFRTIVKISALESPAKPTPTQLAATAHHLIDVADPDQTLGLADYQHMAYAAIADVLSRDRVPFLVGGTGQWVQAVVEGWTVPRVPPDRQLRAELQAEANRYGPERLHARLSSVDPAAAAKLDYRNVRRVIRALEVYLKTGMPISQQQQVDPPPYRILQVGLTMPRKMLYAGVDARVDRMMAVGLLAEVQGLIDRGYGLNLPAMSGLGYRQIGQHLGGHITLDQAVSLIKKETRRFVRQQSNWFQLTDPTIHWVDTSADPPDAASQLVAAFLAS